MRFRTTKDLKKERTTILLDYKADMNDGQLWLWDIVISSSYLSKLYFFALYCDNKLRQDLVALMSKPIEVRSTTQNPSNSHSIKIL